MNAAENKPRAALRWASKYPGLGLDPIPVDPCVSPEFYERERQSVFLNTWLKVARVEQLPNRGDYLAKKIQVAKTSIVLIRGKDDRIRAFHNVCSHRGNKVVVESGEETYGRSKAAVVTCRFHGWVYDARGALVSVPEQERFAPCFAREDHGLTPVHCEVWEGFVFVNFAKQPARSLQEFMGELGTHLAGYPFEKMPQCYAYHTYLDCNWKVVLDAFAEAYHVSTIHAGSFPNVFSSGLSDVQLFDEHRTAAVCLTLNAKPTPVAKIANALSGASLVSQRGASMIPPRVNQSRRDDFSFELSVVFPNLLIHISEGIWFTHQFWPLSHNRTLWEGRYYLPPAKTNSQRWAQEFAQTLQRNAWLEDTATVEATQIGLESGAKPNIILQDEEILVRHGYAVLDRYVAHTGAAA